MGHLPQMWWMMIHGPPNTLDHSKKVAISCHSHGVSMETNVFGMLMFHSYVKWQSRVNAQQSDLSNFMEIQIPELLWTRTGPAFFSLGEMTELCTTRAGNPDDFLLVLILSFISWIRQIVLWLATSVHILYVLNQVYLSVGSFSASH